MPSAAYKDYLIRHQEVDFLLREVAHSSDPDRTSVFCKAAVVLGAAAMERYVNDVVNETCRRMRVQSWDELAEGQQRYMTLQVARRVNNAAAKLLDGDLRSSKQRGKLKEIVRKSHDAFVNPATWPFEHEYGLFMDGSAEPAKIDSTLRMFDAENRNFFDYLESSGKDSSSMARALQTLIDMRHSVAHAKPAAAPSSGDVRSWLVFAVLTVRGIESYLGFRTD